MVKIAKNVNSHPVTCDFIPVSYNKTAIINVTRKLCYRKDDRAMRHVDMGAAKICGPPDYSKRMSIVAKIHKRKEQRRA